jgi:hypothetical protein
METLIDWECGEGTLHSWDENCDCPTEYYDYNYDNQQEYYDDCSDDDWSVDDYQIFMDELNWYAQQEIDEMYNKHNNFTSFVGKSVMNIDSYWFNSDEIEAFRTIWQRRISAM